MLQMPSCQQHSMRVMVSNFQTVPQHIPLNQGKCCSSIAVLSYQSAWSSVTTLHIFWIARGNGNQGNWAECSHSQRRVSGLLLLLLYISESPACSEPLSKQDMQFGVRGRFLSSKIALCISPRMLSISLEKHHFSICSI